MNSLSYPARSLCVAFGDAKRAALFFDRVVVLDSEEFFTQTSACLDLLPPHVSFLDNMLGALWLDGMRTCRDHPEINDISSLAQIAVDHSLPLGHQTTEHDEQTRKSDEFVAQLVFNDIKSGRHQFMQNLLGDYPDQEIEYFWSRAHETDPDGAPHTVDFVLSSLPVVSTEGVEWAQIQQLRSDNQAATKLRRLRTVLYQDFSGKPIGFISDRFAIAIEDHAAAAKKHGLEVVQSKLSVSGAEKFGAGAASALIAAAAGAPITLAAAVGVSAAIGSAVISAVAGRRRQAIIRSADPVSYLVEVAKLPKSNSTAQRRRKQ